MKFLNTLNVVVVPRIYYLSHVYNKRYVGSDFLFYSASKLANERGQELGISCLIEVPMPNINIFFVIWQSSICCLIIIVSVCNY